MPDRHGAEQYTGYLEFILYGYDLDSAIPRMSDAAYCLTPSLQVTEKAHAFMHICHEPRVSCGEVKVECGFQPLSFNLKAQGV